MWSEKLSVLECPLLATVTNGASRAQTSVGWTEPLAGCRPALLCKPEDSQACPVILGTGRWQLRREARASVTDICK